MTDFYSQNRCVCSARHGPFLLSESMGSGGYWWGGGGGGGGGVQGGGGGGGGVGISVT